ncbi:hypothetical protein [Marinobacter sp.]|uniref:hypothetical protein n=1 Tax=Marinobacter sp. TaxID=50741 RepID=UPI00356AEE6B
MNAPDRARKAVPAFVREKHLEQALAELGHQLYYSYPCRLPCLELQLLVSERGREEISKYDLTLLKLISHGIQSPEDLATLTGLATERVESFLRQKEGEFLLEHSNEGWSLTSLGLESIRAGVPLRAISRAARYCALTHRLLPHGAYLQPFDLIETLTAEKIRFQDLIPEPETVPLSGLDLSLYPDRRTVNLTDETETIMEVRSVAPAYSRGLLHLSGKKSPSQAWIQWGADLRAYDLASVKPLVRAFNPDRPSSAGSENTKAQAILNHFEEAGADIASNLEINHLGLPTLTLQGGSDDFFKSSALGTGRPWLAICGTRQYPAIPVTGWPLTPQLQGHTLQVIVANKEMEERINLVRSALRHLEEFYDAPPSQRPTNTAREHLTVELGGSQVSRLQDEAERFQLKRLQAIL